MKIRAAWLLLAGGFAVTGAATSSWWNLQSPPSLESRPAEAAAGSLPQGNAADFDSVSERHTGVFNALERCT